ncbi:leucine-rich repeat receptor-like protein kinase TDR [Malania oleifera]|uniref:leucine-rich repeat receptor-like protein kinase TDR n=1 Tax=Malania oleifera TaxID=397392 RepID=UPI0025AE68B4|nr:leucine-rich repeat receptor-like protein kinase TDR [Malania oleifera]
MRISFPFPLLLAFPFFFSSIPLLSSASLSLQYLSLLSLKASLADPLSALRDWSLPANFSVQDPSWCSWSGIECDPQTGHVISLDLSCQNLSGRIPDTVRHLSELKHLNLSKNAFDGPFPSTIFDLTSLRTLDINHNNFNSTFPPGISKLKSLTFFDAYSNSFTGPLPDDVADLRHLQHLNLGGSYFSGAVPENYGTFERLTFLDLAGNVLEGPVPTQLGFLTQLERLEIGYNQFTGQVPAEFGLLSNLNYLDISNCKLSGFLAPELGNLTKLETLFLFKNQFSGEIPKSYANFLAMKSFDLSNNLLTGTILEEVSYMKEMTVLNLMNNKLSGEIPAGVGELPNLNNLCLWNNSLTGILPQKLGSNGKLIKLDVSSNSLTGPIPPGLCTGNQLQKTILFGNMFTDEIPPTLLNCTSLLRFRAQDNKFNGSIPHGFSLLPNLTFMDISNNNFSGQIPMDLANAPKLQFLNISGNGFETQLPENIWRSPSLQIFSASFCKLTGKIPDFIGCHNIYKIELVGNSLNGSIPWDISHCEKLLSLNLRLNSLTGIIPWEISTLPSITDVDISHNFLTGMIPSNFSNSRTLESFNVSFNLLTGPIPSTGTIFPNLHAPSFAGNDGLCGEILHKPCPSEGSAEAASDQRPPRKTAGAIVWIMAAAFGIGVFVLVAGSRCFRAKNAMRLSGEREAGPWKLTAFQRLNFTAEDVMESVAMSEKIIGTGATGMVYRAEMPGGEIIAVKKLWGRQKEAATRRRRGVLAEVEVLGNVRHRNIVRLLGCCSNREGTMLLYEYMPNGSLEELLHGKNNDVAVTDWLTRHKIALGVAQGICYLHHDCDPVIVHRDLKPSNILLDGEMEARVADFGVAKLVLPDESMSVIAGSYGYIAPEYAYTLQVDEKSDIYSYGVMLMEILSGKRSVDPEFGDGNNIVDWVRTKIKAKNGINDILDENAGASCASVKEEMMLVLRVAILCTSRNPADRPSMRDVVSMLQEAKPKRKLLENMIRFGVNDNVVTCGGGGGGGDTNPFINKPALEC